MSSITDRLLINETLIKEDFSVPSTSFSSSNATLMESVVETEQPNNSPLTLICPYPKAFTGKSDVKRKRESYRVLTQSPEKQELQEEQSAKACENYQRR